MSRTPRIVVETFPNDLIREYHTNVRVTNTPYHEMFGRPDSPSMNELLGREPLGEQGQVFVNDLHAIDGVTEVSLEPYHIRITIAAAFDWQDDVEPQVLDRIKAYFGWADQDVDVRNRNVYGRTAMPEGLPVGFEPFGDPEE